MNTKDNLSEYCGKKCACFKPDAPMCPPEAVIPTIVVENKEGLKGLVNCLVHVSDINTTYYIDDKGRIAQTWAGPIVKDNYDYETNPLKLRDQLVYDFAAGLLIVYNAQGEYQVYKQSVTDFDELTNVPTYAGQPMTSATNIPEVPEVPEVIHPYDTVADMKADTGLLDGDFAMTYGFYANGDGGSAKYKIREITSEDVIDDMTLFALSNENLVAELILQPEMNVAQFGAKGDGITDDQDNINKALAVVKNKINLINGKTYMIKGYEYGQPQGSSLETLSAQTGLVIPSGKTFDLNFAEIKVIANDRKNYNIITLQNVKDVAIENGTLVGDVDTHTGDQGEWGYGISLRKTDNITLSNLHITKLWGDGINMKSYSSEDSGNNTNILILDTTCIDNRRQGMSIEHGDGIIVKNSKFNKTGYTKHTNPASGVDVEPGGENESVSNVQFTNCQFNDNYNDGLLLDCRNSDGDNILIDSCEMSGNLATTSNTTFFADSVSNLEIRNSFFSNNINKQWRIVPIKNFIFKDNHVENQTIVLTAQEATNETFVFTDNIFEFNDPNGAQYNSQIELYSTSSRPSLSGNKLLIANNIFTDNGSGVDIQSHISAPKDKGFDSLELRNNFMRGATRSLLLGINAIIDSNEFIATRSYAFYMDSPSENMIIHIINNTFEQICYTTNHAGAISNAATINIVALNNTVFKSCLNSAFNMTGEYNSSRLLQIQTTSITAPIKTEVGSNYFDNSFQE